MKRMKPDKLTSPARICIAPLNAVGTGSPFELGLMVIWDTTPPPGVVAVGVAAPSLIVKIAVVEARYRVVVAIPPAGRPVPETVSIWIQLASPPNGSAVHCTTKLSTTTSPSIVKVCISKAL